MLMNFWRVLRDTLKFGLCLPKRSSHWKDTFEVLEYVRARNRDGFALLRMALTNSFPVVRNRSELGTECFFSSKQARGRSPSDFMYKLLKIQKQLNLGMTEEGLINHIVMRLFPQVNEYVQNRTTEAQLLQLLAKDEERHVWFEQW
ncbi:uncharacterized protein TNCV_3225981 [Trichonephila clavipes]|nr:uncharacterized protein TNCV_3225981 [Trichonephila clavipes]